MATERGYPGRLEARGPGAHHDDAPGRSSRDQLGQLRLPARAGVLDTGDRLALIDPVDTPLIGSDAQAHVVEPPLDGLAGQIGIGDERTGHPDQVDGAIGQDLLRVNGIYDAAGMEDRHRGHRRLDGGRERDEDAVRRGHVGDGEGLQGQRVRRTADDRKEIHEPGGGQAARDLRHISRGEPTRGHLIARDPRADHPVAPDLAPDLPQDLEAEAHPVLEAAPVFIRPLVEER